MILGLKIWYFVSLIGIISGPFWSKFTEIYDFWWSQGGSPFLKKMYFLNHKCTIFSPFSVKIYTIYDFGGYKRAAPPYLRKICILQAKYT